MTTDQIALARADEAEAFADAYLVQVRKREMDMAGCPCLDHYRRVTEAKGNLASAKRHAQAAVRAANTNQRKKKAA